MCEYMEIYMKIDVKIKVITEKRDRDRNYKM